MKFAFLIQARDHFDTSLYQIENSDAYVLYFKTEIPGPRNLFKPGSTWSEGRNELLKFAYAKKDYDYYILMDDDINTIHKTNEEIEPIGRFKELLTEKLPAIGFTDYSWHLMNHLKERRHLKTNSGFYRPICYDACFNAFHKSIIKYILPYDTKFEKRSWWYSQEIINHLSMQICGNSVLQFNELNTINSLAGPNGSEYPRLDNINDINICFTTYLKFAFKDSGINNMPYPDNRYTEYSQPYQNINELQLDSIEDYVFVLSHEHYRKKRTFWKELS